MAIYLYNQDEIKKIADVCAITANILDDIGDLIEDGIVLAEIDAFVRDLCRKHKGKPAFLGYNGFPSAVCIAVNDEVIHGIPGKDKVLHNGDIVGVDVGVLYKGFFGDSARTYSVGNINDAARSLMDVTREALNKGIAAAIEGNRISDISHAVESCVVEHGFSPVHQFVGHGIGKQLHEEPAIPNFGEPGKGARIRNGMVFAIEPMINAGSSEVKIQNDGWTVKTADGCLSAHFEHTVAVIDGRAVVLTSAKD